MSSYGVGDSCIREHVLIFLVLLPKVGVPGYRISQMVAAGGNVLDAYGLVNVVSPCGLPMRGIVGISPDPIMLLAINCENMKESAAFYERLGFVEQVRHSSFRFGAVVY